MSLRQRLDRIKEKLGGEGEEAIIIIEPPEWCGKSEQEQKEEQMKEYGKNCKVIQIIVKQGLIDTGMRG